MKRIKAIIQREEYYDVPDDFSLNEESFKSIFPNITVLNSVQIISISNMIPDQSKIEE